MKIALLHNCQGPGVRRLMQGYLPGAEVAFFPVNRFTRSLEMAPGDFDLCYLSNQMRDHLEAEMPGFSEQGAFRPLPSILFDGFHPDFCYVEVKNRPLPVFEQQYQSVLAFAAYVSGRDVDAAERLFTPDVMRRAGYLAAYDRARHLLIEELRAHGLDLARRLPVWCRKGPFMHSFNHPRIDVLRDVTLACLIRDGLVDAAAVPDLDDASLFDNLARILVLPVYPPVAHRTGTRGGFRLRLGESRYVSLQEFIAESYRVFAEAGVGAANIGRLPFYFDRVMTVLEAA